MRQECRVSSNESAFSVDIGKGDATFLSREKEDELTSMAVPRPRYFDPTLAIRCSRGGNLPHWMQPRCACFVTWRTADSLPQEKLEMLQAERSEWIRAHSGTWSADDVAEYARLFEGRVQEWLDAGGGACVLRDATVRRLVEDVILRFNGELIFVYALVVMPNHVHVLFMPLGDEPAERIVSAWKGASAHEVNRTLGRTGSFWQKESWDHLVRNERQFAKFVRYIRNNDPKIAYCAYEMEEI